MEHVGIFFFFLFFTFGLQRGVALYGWLRPAQNAVCLRPDHLNLSHRVSLSYTLLSLL